MSGTPGSRVTSGAEVRDPKVIALVSSPSVSNAGDGKVSGDSGAVVNIAGHAGLPLGGISKCLGANRGRFPFLKHHAAIP